MVVNADFCIEEVGLRSALLLKDNLSFPSCYHANKSPTPSPMAYGQTDA